MYGVPPFGRTYQVYALVPPLTIFKVIRFPGATQPEILLLPNTPFPARPQVIVTGPGDRAVTRPILLTVAFVGSELIQLQVVWKGFPVVGPL